LTVPVASDSAGELQGTQALRHVRQYSHMLVNK
jgi:hypothetical protein